MAEPEALPAVVPSGVVAAEGNQDRTVPLLKRKSNDFGWEWGRLCDPNDKTKVKCLICGHESSGGIHQFKQHLAHKVTDVKYCAKVSPYVKEKCKEDLEGT